jgi:hypothetical protein
MTVEPPPNLKAVGAHGAGWGRTLTTTVLENAFIGSNSGYPKT